MAGARWYTTFSNRARAVPAGSGTRRAELVARPSAAHAEPVMEMADATHALSEVCAPPFIVAASHRARQCDFSVHNGHPYPHSVDVSGLRQSVRHLLSNSDV